MAMSLQQSKTRIQSIQSTKKITKAMELVSNSKLKRAKDLHFKVTPFQNELENLMNCVVANIEEKESVYFNINKDSKKNLYIIISSSLGLCGGYNNNIYNFASSIIDLNHDDLIVFGLKGHIYFKNKGYRIIKSFDELPQFNVKEKYSSDVIYNVLKKYNKKQKKRLKLIYTKFINSLTLEPKVIQLLPLVSFKEPIKFKKELQIEPTPQEVLDNLIPFYLTTTLKNYLFESMLSEQASRRIAMENATDNAHELENKLMLEFNKARQALITQEISEISSSADALK